MGRGLKIDYKRELESASKGMIMIHDPQLLIKLIIRMIVHKVQIKHAGMILYDPERDTYVLKISKGERGVKIPAGFARFDKHHPLISLFLRKDCETFLGPNGAVLARDLNKLIWQESMIQGNPGVKELLVDVGTQMQLFGAEACVPAKYKRKLMAVLILGDKRDGSFFEQDEIDFFMALASDVAMAIRNAQLFAKVKKESERNHELFVRTTVVLCSAIDAKDKYTRGHTERVTNISLAIARQMISSGAAQLGGKFLENLYLAAILHDIGKIGVPESILNKPGTLTDEEFDIIRKHPMHGAEILAPLKELNESLDAVKYHHERYDGGGYPYGLKAHEIPMIAAIVAVADAFDAMTTDRPYRKGFSKQDAIDEVSRNIGKQFHPDPARALIDLFVMGKL